MLSPFRPSDHIHGENCLRWPFPHPFDTLGLVCEGVLGDALQSGDHYGFDLTQPSLDVAFFLAFIHVDTAVELDFFLLGRDHCRDVLLRGELQLGDGLETFVDVALHGFRVFGLGEDLK